MLEYRYIVATIYATVLFLDRLDLTIVNITLPTLAIYFKIPITETEWVNTAYILAIATSIPISSWLGDRFGLKKIFIIATTLFGLSSFFCAYSPNLAILSILRFLQGFGGGLVVPVGMSLVYQSFDKKDYASITSYILMPTLIAPAIAPFLGGIITELYGWQWVFLFVVPICLFAVIASVFFIKESPSLKGYPFNWGGVIFAIVTLTSIFYLLTIIGRKEFNVYNFIILIVSIISAYLFIKNEKTSQYPLIQLDDFKNEIFFQANLIQCCFQVCHYGAIFLVSMYLQVSVGMSAKVTGLVMGMQAIGALIVSRYSVKLFRNYGPKVPLVLGFLGVAFVTPCVLFLDSPDMLFWGLFIFLVRGLSSGLCGTPIQTLSILGFRKEQISRASALFGAVRQLSIALGIALSSILINIGLQLYSFSLYATLQHLDKKIFVIAFMFIPIVCLLGVLVVTNINTDKVKHYVS